MSQLFTFGRITSDVELKWSEKSKRHYVYFTIEEQLGYGNQKRFQYFQAWAWGSDAEELVSKKAGKHSRVWAFGTVELVDFVRRDGTKDKGLKLCMTSWGFVSDGTPKLCLETGAIQAEGAAQQNAALPQSEPIRVIRGDNETLPE